MKRSKKQTICEKLNVLPQKPEKDSMVGLAINTLGKGVLNGLRHPPIKNSNGWFIWYGKYSNNNDFFSPVCVNDLEKYLDLEVLEYLDLPEGYRFLIDNKNYEDVWYDNKLLEIDL